MFFVIDAKWARSLLILIGEEDKGISSIVTKYAYSLGRCPSSAMTVRISHICVTTHDKKLDETS